MLKIFRSYFTWKRFFYFLLLRKILVLFLIFSFVLPANHVQAQVPVANFAMNRAVSGVISKAIMKRGFAANDPRYLQTMNAVSGQITALNVVSTVGSVGLTIAGAPVWLTIAAGLGVLGLGAYLVAGQAKIGLETDALTYEPAPSPVPSYSGAAPFGYPPAEINEDMDTALQKLVSKGAHIYRASGCYSTQQCYKYPAFPSGYDPLIRVDYSSEQYLVGGVTLAFTGPYTVAFDSIGEFTSKFVFRPLKFSGEASLHFASAGSPYSGWSNSNGSGPTVTYANGFNWSVAPLFDFSVGGSVRILAKYTSFGTCFGTFENCYSQFVWPYSEIDFASDSPYEQPLYGIKINVSPAGVAQDFLSADELNASLSAYQKGQKLSSSTIAEFADAAWRTAAQAPGYEGVPYTNLAPVTVEDVQDYLVANPAPVVADLLLPASIAGTSSVPIGDNVGNGSSGSNGSVVGGDVNVVNTPNVKIVGKVQLDYGDAPVAAEPTFELPDILAFLEPYKAWRNDLMSSHFLEHVAECPRPTFDLFGFTLVLDSHCALILEHAQVVGAVIIFVASFWAATIVLSA